MNLSTGNNRMNIDLNVSLCFLLEDFCCLYKPSRAETFQLRLNNCIQKRKMRIRADTCVTVFVLCSIQMESNTKLWGYTAKHNLWKLVEFPGIGGWRWFIFSPNIKSVAFTEKQINWKRFFKWSRWCEIQPVYD